MILKCFSRMARQLFQCLPNRYMRFRYQVRRYTVGIPKYIYKGVILDKIKFSINSKNQSIKCLFDFQWLSLFSLNASVSENHTAFCSQNRYIFFNIQHLLYIHSGQLVAYTKLSTKQHSYPSRIIQLSRVRFAHFPMRAK